MSSPRRGADPFWLCHECGAQMRPIRVDGVPHCASCNGEFIEILDAEVNPDPFHELPPAPPVRPGLPENPLASQRGDMSFMESLFGGMMGMAGDGQAAGSQASARGQQHGQNEPGVWSFNIGGGTGNVTFRSFNGNQAQGGMPGPFGPQGGLEAFFPGFAAPGSRATQTPGDPLAGQDLLRAIMAALEGDGQMPQAMFAPQGRMDTGDYVNTQRRFDQILEQLMQAAGPQGPLPASAAVIEGLPRLKLDETALERSQFKDCPVCKDDFTAGEEVVRIPCRHLFHPDCLVPWLKNNGSCPVCRFSLVPHNENRRPPAATPNPTAPPQAAGQSALASTGSDWQSSITSTLNRLFGQGGAPPSPVDERTESSGGVTDYTTLGSTSAPSGRSTNPATNPPATAPPVSEQPTTEMLPASPVPQLSVQPSAIPEDYRERHRQRERNEQPYGDDLD